LLFIERSEVREVQRHNMQAAIHSQEGSVQRGRGLTREMLMMRLDGHAVMLRGRARCIGIVRAVRLRVGAIFRASQPLVSIAGRGAVGVAHSFGAHMPRGHPARAHRGARRTAMATARAGTAIAIAAPGATATVAATPTASGSECRRRDG